MKKVLLASAAAVALGVGATAAHAEDPVKLTLSGNIVQWVGYIGSDSTFLRGKGITSFNTFTQYQDSGITFSGTTKLDNGLTVGATIALETGASTQETGEGTKINQANPLNAQDYITVSGAFGSINAGRMYDVIHDNAVDAPEEGYLFVSDGYWGDPFANGGFLTGQGGNTTGRTVMFDLNVQQSIRYMTPSFSGFQAGIDYGEATSQAAGGLVQLAGTNTGISNNLAFKDAYHAVITYSGDFGDVKPHAFIGYADEQGRKNGAVFYDNTAVNGGVSVTMKGFTVGGSVISRSAPSADQVAGQSGTTWDAGIAYESGPWGVSVAYLNSQAKDATTTSLTDTFQFYEIGAHYTLGPGITLNANVWGQSTKADWSGVNKNGVVLNTAGAESTISGSGALLSTNVSF